MRTINKFLLGVLVVFIVVSIFLAGVYTVLFKLPRVLYDKTFKDVVSETNHTPAIVIYGTLYVENEEINIFELCKKENEKFSFKEVLCVANEKAYFVYSDTTGDGPKWVLASVGLNTKEINNIYSITNVNVSYKLDSKAGYSEKNGYFKNGIIVLNDFKTVIQYDVNNEKVNSYRYEEYTFPENVMVGETIDMEAIALYIDGTKEIFTLSQMAEKSSNIEKIYEKRNKKTWDGSPQLSEFFVQNSVQVIDNKAYCIGECLNFAGEAYVVILEYDQTTGSWKYVSKFFSGDTISRSCYLINSVTN